MAQLILLRPVQILYVFYSIVDGSSAKVLLKSVDGGASWANASNGLPENRQVLTVIAIAKECFQDRWNTHFIVTDFRQVLADIGSFWVRNENPLDLLDSVERLIDGSGYIIFELVTNHLPH